MGGFLDDLDRDLCLGRGLLWVVVGAMFMTVVDMSFG